MRPASDLLPPENVETEAQASPAAAIVPPQVKIALAVGGVVALAILARFALDVFLVLLLVLLLGVLRRTAGDWLGDVLGVRGGTVVFAMAIGLGGWWLVGTDGGRAAVGQLFSEAGRLGFDSVLRERVAVPPSTRPSGPGVNPYPERTLSPSAGAGRAAPAPASREQPAAGRGDQGGPVIPVRLTVRATNTTSDRVVLHATVSAAGGTPDGRVEFRIDGRVVATARIGSDGSAEATVSVPRSGSYSVQARFAGNSRFGPATGATAFTI